MGMRLNSKCWQRETMVAGILWKSVVAMMKMVCSGGSSMVLSSAFQAAFDSMCTSSMTTMRKRFLSGLYLTVSRRLRTSLTPLFDAPSISM